MAPFTKSKVKSAMKVKMANTAKKGSPYAGGGKNTKWHYVGARARRG